jgi:5-methyltetrahydrofolate--homocysteine methyltransferase
VAAGSLIGELTAAGPVLTDGAWGTELQSRGLAAGEIADFWNLSHPDRVEQVAGAYVAAGSKVVLTNTFRANRVALAAHPDVERVAEVNRAGVEVSRRAAGDRARVFASIGPSGKLLMTGEVDEATLRAAFAEQAQALAEGGADAIVVETMSDLAEAEIAVRAAKATGLPVVACMVFDSGKNRDRTMMGVTPRQAAEELTRIGADAIGANCGTGIEDYVSVCAGLAAATPLPIWIKPNAGLPELEDGRAVYRTTPAEFAKHVPRLLEAGARFVGGCCGTHPGFIEAIRRELDG